MQNGEKEKLFIYANRINTKIFVKKRLEQDVLDLEETFSHSKLKSISLENTYLPIYYNSWLYDYHNDPLTVGYKYNRK